MIDFIDHYISTHVQDFVQEDSLLITLQLYPKGEVDSEEV